MCGDCAAHAWGAGCGGAWVECRWAEEGGWKLRGVAGAGASLGPGVQASGLFAGMVWVGGSGELKRWHQLKLRWCATHRQAPLHAPIFLRPSACVVRFPSTPFNPGTVRSLHASSVGDRHNQLRHCRTTNTQHTGWQVQRTNSMHSNAGCGVEGSRAGRLRAGAGQTPEARPVQWRWLVAVSLGSMLAGLAGSSGTCRSAGTYFREPWRPTQPQPAHQRGATAVVEGR